MSCLPAPLFTTPSTVTQYPSTQSGSRSQHATDHETTPVTHTPSHVVTPSPMAVWRLLGLEPMSDTYNSAPLYLRASELHDPAVGEAQWIGYSLMV